MSSRKKKLAVLIPEIIVKRVFLLFALKTNATILSKDEKNYSFESENRI